MIRSPELDNQSRLLVVAPHPDDETLATGGLIQMALAAGAKLRVIVATDGDNNPWPQRWIERRWRIDASARACWGARRRGEASMALARLGVSEQDVRYLGWPDQGLTKLLMRDSRSTDQMASEILEFAPTVMAVPSLADQHPDHNALGAMLDIALSSSPFACCPRLSFVVHGVLPDADAIAVPSNVEYASRKLHALQAHASQLILSEGRMTRLCKRRELYESTRPDTAGCAATGPLVWRWPIGTLRKNLQRHAAYLIVYRGSESSRLELPIERVASAQTVEFPMVGGAQLVARLRVASDGIELELHGRKSVDRAYAKIERLGNRLMIYDRQGWSVKGSEGRSG